MGIRIGILGAGQFARQFAHLFDAHPDVDGVVVADADPARASRLVEDFGLAGVLGSDRELMASSVDAIAIFTQRWTHGALTVQALAAGKHVYSSVPMGMSLDELVEITRAVRSTGLQYMMGETSYYNPTTMFARELVAEGAFGSLFYAEGDYVHDMDNGFYDAYRFSGGDDWKRTASYPPMLYPTHAIGGVLGAWDERATSVSCIGVPDTRGDGVFQRELSMFDNEFSNQSALFHLSGGGVMRTNEFRRVGYPSSLRESRFRFFGTDASVETLGNAALLQTREDVTDVTDLLECATPTVRPGEVLTGTLAAGLRDSFESGYAPVQQKERLRLPEVFRGLPTGHEGAHHFLVDDFVRSVMTGVAAPVDVEAAARFTLPGIIAHESARQGGARLEIPDLSLEVQ